MVLLKSISTLSDRTSSTTLSWKTDSTRNTSSTSLSPSPPLGCLLVTTQTESLELPYGLEKGRRRKQKNNCSRPSVVRFLSVDIYFHAIILGDNPSVLDGPPITIDWECFHSPGFVSMNEYEASIADRVVRRGNELIIPVSRRLEMLKNANVTPKQIRKIETEGRIIRRHRENSNAASGDVIPLRQRRKRFLPAWISSR